MFATTACITSMRTRLRTSKTNGVRQLLECSMAKVSKPGMLERAVVGG